MPRRIKSLKDATLFAIAKNIKFWGDMIPEDPDTYLYLLSPFEVLDHGLTQAVFDALVKYDAFLPKHIHLIFHSNLHSIDLSKCANFKLGENVLRTLLKRSKKIKNLKISGRTRYARSLLNRIPQHYPNLQSITLTHESISDDFVVNLASNCPHLVTFKSSSCAKLNQESFKIIAKLQSLHILTLGNADNLSDEDLVLILKSCKKLNSLSLPMARVGFRLLKGEVFPSLKSLDLTLSDSVDDTSVENIAASITYLRDLCLSNCDRITNKSLQIITNQCKHLENLNISYSGIKKYSDDMKNLLIKIGHNLHSIDFSGIRDIRIAIFGEYCPHLEKLFLNHCPYMATEWITHDAVLGVIARNSQHNDRFLNGLLHQLGKRDRYSLLELCPLLKTLQLDFRKQKSYIVGYDLESILHGGCNLEMLGLTELPVFTDDDVRNLENYTNIASIKHLVLSGNSSVTMDGVWYAIEHMSSLEIIDVRDCDVIKNEWDELKKRVKKRGYDIELVGLTRQVLAL